MWYGLFTISQRILGFLMLWFVARIYGCIRTFSGRSKNRGMACMLYI